MKTQNTKITYEKLQIDQKNNRLVMIDVLDSNNIEPETIIFCTIMVTNKHGELVLKVMGHGDCTSDSYRNAREELASIISGIEWMNSTGGES